MVNFVANNCVELADDLLVSILVYALVVKADELLKVSDFERFFFFKAIVWVCPDWYHGLIQVNLTNHFMEYPIYSLELRI